MNTAKLVPVFELLLIIKYPLSNVVNQRSWLILSTSITLTKIVLTDDNVPLPKNFKFVTPGFEFVVLVIKLY